MTEENQADRLTAWNAELAADNSDLRGQLAERDEALERLDAELVAERALRRAPTGDDEIAGVLSESMNALTEAENVFAQFKGLAEATSNATRVVSSARVRVAAKREELREKGKPTVCGVATVYPAGGVCDLPPGHTGAHRHADRAELPVIADDFVVGGGE